MEAPDDLTSSGPRRPGRPRGSVASTTGATRDRITEIAIELFSTLGYHATSVSEIGERTGLRPGALYYHIKSKEDLLWEILESYTQEALAGARQVVAMDLTPIDKLNLLIDRHVRTIARHRREVLIQLRDADALTAEHNQKLQAMRQEVQRCWEDVLDEGQRAGDIARSNRTVANGLLGMLNSVPQWYHPGHGQDIDTIARELRAMVIDGLAR
ncbi:TetR/AcrR family transcriptional regulator [Rhodococcus sp. NCIMB 12038]|uniref:TetR/AcrR family transcriptional regulator n=1 Tax=Rhodococcus sp. NCIMB 12038 TaxID=933800 RepID=UPI0015C68425|nr:TetR/AcrR family transcriptional regulator [Rhodococcus sp. NCIMB 12038]